MRTTARLLTALIIALAALAGCSQPSGNEGDVANQGYQSGDGSVRQWAPADRSEPVRLAGTDFGGGAVDTAQLRGEVVVVNTWYAACPPCRKEAPALVDFAKEFAGRAHVVGLNSTDDAGAAEAFQRTFSVPYPSIADADGSATAALQGVVPLQAVPTTVVLDRQGRVAARVLGEITHGTLTAIVGDVLAEPAASGASTPGSAAPATAGRP